MVDPSIVQLPGRPHRALVPNLGNKQYTIPYHSIEMAHLVVFPNRFSSTMLPEMGEIMGISDYIFAIIIPTDIISILPMGRNWCDPIISHFLPPAVAVRQASRRSRYVGSSPPSCARPMPAAPPPRWTTSGFHVFVWGSWRFHGGFMGCKGIK